MWYVKAADQGDERAKHRIAAIQAASEGANPNLAASGAVGSRGKLKSKFGGAGKWQLPICVRYMLGGKLTFE